MASVTDSISLAKFAYELYSNGIVIARHAPDEFRQLLHELDLVRKILWALQVHVASDIGQEDGYTKETLRLCKSALSDFKPLLAKYEKLAYTDRGLWLRKFQWAADQNALKKCRDNLKRYQDMLQLALHPNLRNGQTLSPPEALPSEASSPNQLPTSPDTISSKFNHQRTGNSLTSELSVQSSPSDFPPPSTYQSTPNTSDGISSYPVGPELPTAEQLGIRDLGFDWPWDSSQSEPVFPDCTSLNGPDIFSHSVQLNPGREKYHVSSSLNLELSRRQALMKTEIDTVVYLRLATWWLLKSQTIFTILANSAARSALRTNSLHETSWENAVSAGQASVDLAKSSWIIEDLIISRDPLGEHLHDVVWGNLKDLSDSIHQNIIQWRDSVPTLIPLKDSSLLELDLNLTEPFAQPIEEPQRLPAALDSMSSPWRWITTRIENAGDGPEHVLFRTFVNAQLGGRTIRRRTGSAPYMLVLWCQQGYSDITVSLCNQHSTVNLSRNLTMDDLTDFEDSARADDEIEICFPSLPAIIKFLNTGERMAFLEYPQRFFAEMLERAPRSEEFLVFRDTLKLKSHKNWAPQVSSTAKPQVYASNKACEISLYELMVDECWKTTRRMVISSDAAVRKHWCTSSWLPLGGIQVLIEERDVSISWSNFNHHERRTNGYWGIRHYYEYDQERPNCSISVEFKDNKSAKLFADRLLHPFETPFMIPYLKSLAVFDSSLRQAVQVYEVRDPADDGSKGYHAIVLTEQRQNLKRVSDVFFAYRDFDFAVENGPHPSVAFPSLRVPQYISDKTDMISPNDEDGRGASFSEIVPGFRPARLTFDCSDKMALFMQYLVGWQLIFCRRVRAVHVRRGLFSKTQSNATVYLWETPSDPNSPHAVRLAVRSEENNGPQWTTASISDPHRTTDRPVSFKVVFKGVKVERGTEIDSRTMTASDPASIEPARPDWRGDMTIIFQENRDSSRFMKCHAACHASEDEADL